MEALETNIKPKASEGKGISWAVYVHSDDKSVHVVPKFGRVHLLSMKCWCAPHRDTKMRTLLIHECDN